MNQPINQIKFKSNQIKSMNQLIKSNQIKSINPSLNQPIIQSINKSIHQSINQSFAIPTFPQIPTGTLPALLNSLGHPYPT